MVNDNQHETLTVFDTVNRIASMTDQKGNVFSYEYDENSNVVVERETEIADVDGAIEQFASTFDYDHLDRLTGITDNVGNTATYTYDSRNNRTFVSDALRTSANQNGNITTYEFDGLNRLIATNRFLTSDGTGSGTSAGVIRMTQSFDDNSRVIAVTDANINNIT